MFDEYLKTTGKPIEASIRGELSGDFEKLMLAVGMSKVTFPGPLRDSGTLAQGHRDCMVWRWEGENQTGGEF